MNLQEGGNNTLIYVYHYYRIKNEFLNQMGGFDSISEHKTETVLILAATNRPWVTHHIFVDMIANTLIRSLIKLF
jgi:hypothetical protein